MTPGERALWDEAARCPELPTLGECTRENLKSLAERRGVDFATALVYDRVRRSPQHGSFIEQLETLIGTASVEPAPGVRVVIVPGAFHLQFPHSGADGRVVREQAETLGLRVESVPLPNFSSLADNAAAICDWLEACDAERVILASTSKGGSDIKCALALPQAEAAFSRVAYWLNLSGLLEGTPLIEELFSFNWRSRITRRLFQWRGFDLELMAELAHGPATPLDIPLRLPPHLEALHVVGFPLKRHATNRLARGNFARLEPHGPNDAAGIMLGDACQWPGLLYPIWGTDHYLRPKRGDIAGLARALLCYACRRLAQGDGRDSCRPDSDRIRS